MHAAFLDLAGMTDLDLGPIQAQVQNLSTYEYSSPDQMYERLKQAQVAIANKAPLDAELLQRLTDLRLICVSATGVNNVDLEVARQQGIAVFNCQAYGISSVAQHVIMLILALHTRLLAYDRDVRAGKWQSASMFCLLDHPIAEVEGQKLGIVGYGNLGKAVAAKASALGMEVLVAARPGTAPTEGRISLDQLLEQVDILSLHCPLNEDTKDLIGEREIARMRPGSFLLNTARGGIVNEQATVDALKSGHLGGAAFDVLVEEPPVNGNPLLQANLPNLIVTPHNAWGSRQARMRIIEQIGENIHNFTQGSPIRRLI